MNFSKRQLRSLQTRHATLARHDSAAIRINVAPVDRVGAMLAADDPSNFLERIKSLATKTFYPQAARALELLVLPAIDQGRPRRLIKTIIESPLSDDVRYWRCAVDLQIIRGAQGALFERFTFENLIDATKIKRTARKAWAAIHLLGHVRFNADAVIPISECVGETVGMFPRLEIERAALALHLLVKIFQGERFGAINLVRS